MSDRPLAERLEVKGERRLAVLHAPEGFASQTDRTAAADVAEVALLFVTDRAALEAGLPEALATVRANAILWIAYPKLTSPLARDLSRDVLRGLVPSHGLDTVAQIALDADWSALRMKRTA